VDRRIQLFVWNVRLCPIENPPFIGTGGNAVSATDAPVIVHHDHSIWFLPGGVDRANLHTGRILALLALDGEIEKPLFWNRVRVIVMVGVFEIDEVSPFESENSDPLKLRIMARLIVFFYTGIDASSAPNASGKLEAVCPKGIRDSFCRTDLKFPSILLQVSLFQLSNDLFLFFLGHFVEMFL